MVPVDMPLANRFNWKGDPKEALLAAGVKDIRLGVGPSPSKESVEAPSPKVKVRWRSKGGMSLSPKLVWANPGTKTPAAFVSWKGPHTLGRMDIYTNAWLTHTHIYIYIYILHMMAISYISSMVPRVPKVSCSWRSFSGGSRSILSAKLGLQRQDVCSSSLSEHQQKSIG